MGEFFISPEALRDRLGGPSWPLVFDVRRREAFLADERVAPTARWRPHASAEVWAHVLPTNAEIVVYCVHGRQVSQAAASALRARGYRASALAGGIEGWREAGGPTVLKGAMPGRDETQPSRWITRMRPKIDRIACPWFIRRFVDASAEFHFVAADQVLAAAAELNAIPYDVEDAPFIHREDGCTFDDLVERFGVEDEPLRALAPIVRGADTGRPDLAAEASGLLAMSLGLSVLAGADDRLAVDRGMLFYDCLYAWRRRAASQTHGRPARRDA